MNLDRLFNVAGAIVTVAMVTVFLTSPQTANVIRAVGGSFSEAIRSAMGRR